ncbi:MAG: hypothetical protein RI897_2179 [Verrucomicrobiota bacterium]
MTHVETMVSRQVMLTELKRRLEEEGHRVAPAMVDGVVYGPCLLVSRSCGSGGRSLAGVVGQRLGWWVVDREIVEEIAVRSHVRARLVESVDARVRSKWTSGVAWLADGIGLSPGEYLQQLRQVILALGHHGDVVIMGRGAQYMLPSRGMLRLRVVAPLEVRVQRIVDREHLSVEQARRWVGVKDVERDEYLRRTFGRDAARAEDYDLVVNTGELELERAADVVVAALRGKFGELSRLLPACGRAIGAEDGVGAGRALQPGSLMEAER